ncbi:MAG: PepSY1/2 domain-containing protein [Candidatus Howiella sp.]|jgi:spore germination protein
MKTSTLSKRACVRIISFAAAFVIVAGVALITLYTERNNYRMQVEYAYELALEDLTASLERIDTELKKGVYCTSAAGWNEIASNLSAAAGTAKSAISSLPFSGGELTTVGKFLSQVGNYAGSLSRKMVEGTPPADRDTQNLRLLSQTAASLYTAVSDIRYGVSGFANSAIGEAGSAVEELSAALIETDEAITDYPTLVYDGPFSDHLLNAAPKLLSGHAEITREGARQVAALYLGESTSDIADDGEEESAMPSYCFSSGNTSIYITKQGGFCSYFRKYREIGDPQKTYDEAIRIAAEYLDRLELGSFTDSYYMTDEGMCVINFAYTKDGVICYPDLIKVGVALDTGEVLLFEGRGYIMNHTARELPAITKTVEEAEATLSTSLTVERVGTALIPTDGGEEKLCYEFSCTDGDQRILVYVNCNTLEQENILILLMVDGGMLTR